MYPKIRRVMLTTDAVGGVWNFTFLLAKELSRRNVSVILAGFGPYPSHDKIQLAKEIPNLSFHWRPFPLEWMAHGTACISSVCEWLRGLAKEKKVDLVHLAQFSPAVAGFDVPCLITAHSSVCTWHRAVYNMPVGSEWESYSQSVRAGLAAASAVTAPTQALLDAIEQEYGLGHTVTPIPNGVEIPHNPSEKEEYVLTVGRLWDEAKNVELVNQVAGDLTWPVVAIGPLTDPQGDHAEFRHILTTGEMPPESVYHWMSHAGIFVSPVKYEPFGLAILEAASLGCALVLGDIPTLRELWEGCAVFVDPQSPEDLSRALRRVTTSKSERVQLAQRAKERSSHYSLTHMVDRYQLLYHQLTLKDSPQSLDSQKRVQGVRL